MRNYISLFLSILALIFTINCELSRGDSDSGDKIIIGPNPADYQEISSLNATEEQKQALKKFFNNSFLLTTQEQASVLESFVNRGVKILTDEKLPPNAVRYAVAGDQSRYIDSLGARVFEQVYYSAQLGQELDNAQVNQTGNLIAHLKDRILDLKLTSLLSPNTIDAIVANHAYFTGDNNNISKRLDFCPNSREDIDQMSLRHAGSAHLIDISEEGYPIASTAFHAIDTLDKCNNYVLVRGFYLANPNSTRINISVHPCRKVHARRFLQTGSIDKIANLQLDQTVFEFEPNGVSDWQPPLLSWDNNEFFDESIPIFSIASFLGLPLKVSSFFEAHNKDPFGATIEAATNSFPGSSGGAVLGWSDKNKMLKVLGSITAGIPRKGAAGLSARNAFEIAEYTDEPKEGPKHCLAWISRPPGDKNNKVFSTFVAPMDKLVNNLCSRGLMSKRGCTSPDGVLFGKSAGINYTPGNPCQPLDGNKSQHSYCDTTKEKVIYCDGREKACGPGEICAWLGTEQTYDCHKNPLQK